jgi:tetratricopeptide (TPR) repeat protein
MSAVSPSTLLIACVLVGTATAQHGGAANHGPRSPGHDAAPSSSADHGAPDHGAPDPHRTPAAPGGAVPAGGLLHRPIYTLHQRGESVLVDADRASVTALEALEELARILGWRLHFESALLERALARETVNLSISGERPERLARLIAVAGGADAQVSVPPVGLGLGAPELMVIRAASPASDEGRLRLRRWASDWYRTFLQDHQLEDPLVQREGASARMHLGTLLKQSEDFEGASRWFGEVADGDRSHPFRPRALLELAECQYELYQTTRGDRPERHLELAERYLAELAGFHPSIPETAAGAVLYGRVLIALGRHKECIGRMRDHAVKLAQMPEIVDIHLLIGEAQRQLGRAEEALVSTDNVASVQQYVTLSRRQWLDFLFLRGWALTEIGFPREALGQLELFLGLHQDDPRHGQVLVILTKAYLALGRYLEARSAALATYPLREQLDDAWRSEALELEARTRIAIGQRDEALTELEARIAGQTPFELETDLGLFLIDEYMHDGSYQKVLRVADMLIEEQVAEVHPDVADEARLRRIQAMYRQARRDGILRGFPVRAIEHAERLQRPSLRQEASELIGQAWLELGDADRAADALRGLLRR